MISLRPATRKVVHSREFCYGDWVLVGYITAKSKKEHLINKSGGSPGKEQQKEKAISNKRTKLANPLN